MNPFGNRKPVFEPSAFHGRTAELEAIHRQLSLQPPQCCAVVGLPRSGKTSLLYHLHDQARLPHEQRQPPWGKRQQVLAVYVNAGPYLDMDAADLQGALYFWRDLDDALRQALRDLGSAALEPDPAPGDQPVLDQLHSIRHAVAAAIRDCPADLVLLLLDNAEGIARLPRLTGSLLRTLTQDPALGERVAYVATSQRPVHQLYEEETWQAPSSFWNLFASTVHLGQLTPQAAQALMARSGAADAAARFTPEQERLLLDLAGRHPDLLSMACALLYDRRAQDISDRQEREMLEMDLYDAARPLCRAIWQALATTPGAHELLRRAAASPLPAAEPAPTAMLTRLGVLDEADSQRPIFSRIMVRWVAQEAPAPVSPPESRIAPAAENVAATAAAGHPAFTHLEGAVYTFLAANAGVVCDRERIKRAVWEDDLPSDSALQKLIERIREKIEVDPKQPRRLLAVRGQGYILHPDNPPG